MPALAEPPAAPAVARRPPSGPADSAPPRPDVAYLPIGAGRATLRGVNWDEYVALREKPENAHLKMTFDGPAGLLEIETPEGLLHATVAAMIGSMISAFARRRRVPVRPTSSVTLSREDVDRGLEGDVSYYIRHHAAIAGKTRLDLTGGDPPPDLAVEVDVTSPGVSKLPIYAALGVPEVWDWQATTGALTARRLTAEGEYEVVTQSAELPGFPLDLAAELIARGEELFEFEMLDEFEARLPPAGSPA